MLQLPIKSLYMEGHQSQRNDCIASDAYLSTLRFWPEAADVGVATVVVAGAELLAGMVGEVDITRTFLSHNAKVVPSRWFCFWASCLSAQVLITDQVLLFVEIYQTRASLPQKLLQKLMNPEMNSEIENKKFIFAWTPIYIFKDGKNYRDLLSKIKV